MKVSIVTISFNQGGYLRRNRRSVEAQDYPIEHVIVDPGSTDGSRELIREWAAEDPDVVAIFERDAGPADGLNKGFRAISGDVWLYLNSDDELAPGAIEHIVRVHADQPQIDVLIGNGWTIGADGAPIRFVRSDRFSPARYAAGVGTVLQQATSFKRRVRGPETIFNQGNRYNWDTELLFDLYRGGATFSYTDEVLGYFRLQPESITMSGRHLSGLQAERDRLISSVPNYPLLRALSLPARALKRANPRQRFEKFPGLAGD